MAPAVGVAEAVEQHPRWQDTSSVGANVIRELGCIESYQLALQSLDHMRGNILAYRYKIPPRLSSHNSRLELISTFEKAVARVVLKHPNLHVGIMGEHTHKPCWVRLDRINLQDHIEWHIVEGDDVAMQKAFVDVSYQGLDTKFSNYRTKPGWKVKVVRQENTDYIEVLFVLNHTYLDGVSAKIFHRDLLQSLYDDPEIPEVGSLREHILTLPENSAAGPSPPAESLVPFPVDRSALLHYLQQEVHTPASTYANRPTQAHWAPIAAAPFKTQFRTITIPKDVLSDLLRACRHHNTTITGLLHALIWVSLTPLLDPSKALAFEALTAMDLRALLPRQHPSYPGFDPAQAMSNYVTIMNHIFDENLVSQLRHKTSFYAPDSLQSGALMNLVWTAARKVRRELEDKVGQGLENDMNGFAQAVSDWRAQLSEEARRPRRTSWVITNLGLIDGNPAISSSAVQPKAEEDPEPTWSVVRTQLIMCANVVASAIGVSTAAVKGGDLIITCAWQDCVVDPDVGRAFVTSLERWLNFTSQYPNGWPKAGSFSYIRNP